MCLKKIINGYCDCCFCCNIFIIFLPFFNTLLYFPTTTTPVVALTINIILFCIVIVYRESLWQLPEAFNSQIIVFRLHLLAVLLVLLFILLLTAYKPLLTRLILARFRSWPSFRYFVWVLFVCLKNCLYTTRKEKKKKKKNPIIIFLRVYLLLLNSPSLSHSLSRTVYFIFFFSFLLTRLWLTGVR